MEEQKHKQSWQNKIDPCFDEMVKSYVELLEFCEELPSDGQLSLNDEFSEVVDNDSGWQDNYFCLDDGEDLRHFVEDTVLQGAEVFQLLDYPYEDKQGYLDICERVAKSLPDQSKAFHLNEIASYRDNPDFKAPFNMYEGNVVASSSISSLVLRKTFLILDEVCEPEATKEEIEGFKQPEIMNNFIGFVNSMVSQLAFKSTLKRLLEEFVKEGKDKSLCDALKIDKTVLYFDEVEERIREAQLKGDKKFFRSIGKAIAETPFERSSGSGHLVPVFIFFWIFGLNKLSRPEQHEFAIYCKLISPQYSFGAFEKEIQRYILPCFT